MGVGNEFKADDFVGPAIARRLARSFGKHERIIILDAGTAPENFTGSLRRFMPDLVVLIDALEMEVEPGDIAWVEWDSLDGISAFTHAPAPEMLGNFIREELHARVALIGIQPGRLEFDSPPTPAVRISAGRVAAGIRRTLQSTGYDVNPHRNRTLG
jgi:hydrogenase 3 maturation protease